MVSFQTIWIAQLFDCSVQVVDNFRR
jgi:hypothetical protein